MDPIYRQGLIEAKELYDSGVLNEAEFADERKKLVAEKDLRTIKRKEKRAAMKRDTRAGGPSGSFAENPPM